MYQTTPLPPAYPAPPKPPWYRRTWGILVIAFVCLGIGGAIAQGSTNKKPSAEPATPTVTVTATATQTIESATHKDAAKPARVAAPAKPVVSHVRRSPAVKRTRSHAATLSSLWTMPNEVGRVLQTAQDDLQRVSGDPVFFSHSHDLLGDRFQMLDSDWQVCDQNVAPGTRVGQFAHIDFGVVKSYEQCP